jgi:hypothetical protein
MTELMTGLMPEPATGLEAGGAYEVFTGPGNSPVPLYLLAFDKEGTCVSPKTRDKVLAEAGGRNYSAVHIYSHGWNNVFAEAVEHYTEFFTEYFALRANAAVDADGYKPMIVGIIWPSTALLSADEIGPTPAAARVVAAADDAAIAELAAELQPGPAGRFIALASANRPLDEAESAEFAQLLLAVLRRDGMLDGVGESEGNGGGAAVDAAQVVRSWASPASAPDDGERGKPRPLPGEGKASGTASGAAAAGGGFFSFLDPREIIRKATVFLMKDRAGIVGRKGVGDLLRDILRSNNDIRVHLTGHSYGAKVVLSALSLQAGERQVASVLLLQPAVNAYCFADRIPDAGATAGAYRAALAHTVLPIYTTFSARDMALSRFFRLALRRSGDPGEIGDLLLGGGDDKFAALGAVGPLGMLAGESEILPMIEPPAMYPPPPAGVRVVALDGSVNGIGSHGDVRNRFTEWTMVNLVGNTS